jgi:hypothetical protein
MKTLMGVMLLCGHWKVKKGELCCRPDNKRVEGLCSLVSRNIALTDIFLLKLIYYGTRLFRVEILDKLRIEMTTLE